MTTIEEMTSAIASSKSKITALERAVSGSTARLADLEAGRDCPATVPEWLASKRDTSARLESDRDELARLQSQLAALEAQRGDMRSKLALESFITTQTAKVESAYTRMMSALKEAQAGYQEVAKCFTDGTEFAKSLGGETSAAALPVFKTMERWPSGSSSEKEWPLVARYLPHSKL